MCAFLCRVPVAQVNTRDRRTPSVSKLGAARGSARTIPDWLFHRGSVRRIRGDIVEKDAGPSEIAGVHDPPLLPQTCYQNRQQRERSGARLTRPWRLPPRLSAFVTRRATRPRTFEKVGARHGVRDEEL